ncbi:MAG: transposase [Candidatus Hydrogenedentes bacterium]|nr:transposase [Candidatus Hydrogenedentota bacterium]
MPRTARIVLPGVPHHITQRGNNRQQVFFDDADHKAYLAMLREEALDHGFRILGYCLMPNHVHIVGIPARKASLARTVGAANFRYTVHAKRKYRRHGHLWQGRFYSCPMDENHTIRALCYVELNPVRAGMQSLAWEYTWSSAKAHSFSHAESSLLNLERWRGRFTALEWREHLLETSGNTAFLNRIRYCTQKGRPLGDADFEKRAMRIAKGT